MYWDHPPEGYTLDALAREGARRMLMSALEVAAYMERHAEARDGEGRRLCSPQRASAGAGHHVWCRHTGSADPSGQRPAGGRRGGAVPVHEPDSAALHAPLAEGRGGPAGFVFAGTFDGGLPPGARAAARRGGRGFLATNIARLTGGMGGGVPRVSQAPPGGPRLRLCVGDGVHFNVRLEEERLCTLVLIGARADGQKELIAVESSIPCRGF